MISGREIARLKAFHASHFQNQPVPDIKSSQQVSNVEEPQAGDEFLNDDDGLGYYDDGVKRTLTDQQIKMFRHSEIQRLLAERRAACRKDENGQQKVDEKAKTNQSFKPREWPSYDKPAEGQPAVDTLMYDETPEIRPPPKLPEKQFLWPTLGNAGTKRTG
jgi:hypothetical protein